MRAATTSASTTSGDRPVRAPPPLHLPPRHDAGRGARGGPRGRVAPPRTARRPPRRHAGRTRRIVSPMIEITEIGADGLERWGGPTTAVRPDRPGSAGRLHRLEQQAEDMTWLIARADGVDAGTGFAYDRLALRPSRDMARSTWLSRSGAARGVGSALLERAFARWAAGASAADARRRARSTSSTTTSLAWASRRGFSEVGRNSTLSRST